MDRRDKLNKNWVFVNGSLKELGQNTVKRMNQTAGKLDKEVFSACKTKTTKTLAKLMEQVPKQDAAMAKKIKETQDDAKKVEKAAADLRGLISKGITPGGYKDFTAALNALKESWKLAEVAKKNPLVYTMQQIKHLKGDSKTNECSTDPLQNMTSCNFEEYPL